MQRFGREEVYRVIMGKFLKSLSVKRNRGNESKPEVNERFREDFQLYLTFTVNLQLLSLLKHVTKNLNTLKTFLKNSK